jgi:hypothetical protein
MQLDDDTSAWWFVVHTHQVIETLLLENIAYRTATPSAQVGVSPIARGIFSSSGSAALAVPAAQQTYGRVCVCHISYFSACRRCCRRVLTPVARTLVLLAPCVGQCLCGFHAAIMGTIATSQGAMCTVLPCSSHDLAVRARTTLRYHRGAVCTLISLYVCMYVCMYMYARIHVGMCPLVHVSMFICFCIRVPGCVCVCVCVCERE